MPRVKHNRSGTPEYYAWRNMHRRCSNPLDDSYQTYGGRGIWVCEQWKDLDQFLKDMGPRPYSFQLDRIDPNGHYTPENCRWASAKTQANNTRRTIRVLYKGRLLPISEVAELINIKRDTLRARLVRRKIAAERAVLSQSLRRVKSHGTRHGYETGCRCADCRAANAAHHRRRRAKRKAQTAIIQALKRRAVR